MTDCLLQSDPVMIPFVVVALPATCLLFFFSIKGPSAHTFWIWFPMSFVLPLRHFARRPPGRLWWGYLACSLVFSLWGFCWASLGLPQIGSF
jgi:hypothetical protein